jgi:hypothetical protein
MVGLLRINESSLFGYGCVLAKKAAAFFRNSFSIRNRLISVSISATAALSIGDKSFEGPGLLSFQAFTQL